MNNPPPSQIGLIVASCLLQQITIIFKLFKTSFILMKLFVSVQNCGQIPSLTNPKSLLKFSFASTHSQLVNFFLHFFLGLIFLFMSFCKGRVHLKSSHFLAVLPADPPSPPYNLTTFGRILLDLEIQR